MRKVKKWISSALAAVMVAGVMPCVSLSALADESTYDLNTTTQDSANSETSPYTLGYYTVSTGEFTQYPKWVNNNCWQNGTNVWDDGGGISVSSSNSASFVGTQYESAVIFTAPKSGAIKVDWQITPPGIMMGADLTDGNNDGIGYRVDKITSSETKKLYPKNDKAWRVLDRGMVVDARDAYTYVNEGDKIQLRFNSLKTQYSDTFIFRKFTVTYVDNVVFEKDTEYLTWFNPESDSQYASLNTVDLSAVVMDDAEIISYTSSDDTKIAPVLGDGETVNTTGIFELKGNTAPYPLGNDIGTPVTLTCTYKNSASDSETKTITKNVHIISSNYLKHSGVASAYSEISGNLETYRYRLWDYDGVGQGFSSNGPIWYYGLAYPRGHAADDVEYGFDYFDYTGTKFSTSNVSGLEDWSSITVRNKDTKNNLTSGGDTVIAFKAPKDGNVIVSLKDGITAYGDDGLRLAIRKGTTKLYPQGDSEWQTVAKDETLKPEAIVTNVKAGEYIYYVLNINENNYSDAYTCTPQVQYLTDNANISFDQEKYMLTYCTQDWDKEANDSNTVEMNVTIPDVSYLKGKTVSYTTSDETKLKYNAETGKFDILGATGINDPITVTASTDNGFSASTKVYIFEQKLTSSDNPNEYPLYTGKTEAIQGPVWYAQYAAPVGETDLSKVTYADLTADIRESGSNLSTILWKNSDLYAYGNVRKDSVGTAHTGANGDVTFVFKAPKAGKVIIGSKNPFEAASKPDGFRYRIVQNNTQLYPETGWASYNGYADEKIAFVDSVDTTVEKGDKIYITINHNTTNNNGGFRYVPMVTYVNENTGIEGVNANNILAITNISENGGTDNNDTLQNAVAKGQATIKVDSEDVNYLADAADNQTPGGDYLDGAATIDISLTGNSQGKALKNLDVIMKSDLTNNKGCYYDLTFQYKKVGEESFTTFYHAVSTKKPGMNTTYPAVRLTAENNAVTNIDTIRIISASTAGIAASISEIDLNTTEDSAEVAAAKTAKANELTLNKLYQDNMMFQQNKPIRITGKGGNGTVTATLSGAGNTYTKTTTGNPDGWEIELDAISGSFDEYTLTVADKDTTKTFTNILIGELWLASGQSNMGFYEVEASHFEEDKASATNDKIRFFYQQPTYTPLEPAENNLDGTWYAVSSANIGRASSVAYHFALNLYEQLGGTVPVGFMQAALGGAKLQSLVPETFLTEHGYDSLNDSKAYDTYDETSDNPKFRFRATGAYNGSINPLKNMNFGGVIWYQGEGDTSDTVTYKKMQPEFIGFLRTLLRDEELPFIMTQLASWGATHNAAAAEETKINWPKMREVQMQNMLTVPNTGMAVTIDTGLKDDIHPKDKRPVGKRLALIAAAKFFDKDVEYMGPMLEKVTKQGDDLVISFTHAEGIKVTSGETINNFEVSEDGVTWTTATATLVDGKVQVSANGASKVRYCYTGFAENVNLYNSADLPAMPFNAAAQETGEWTVIPNGDSAQVSKTELNTDTLVKNEQLIVAVYKENGSLVRVQSVPVTAIINENVSVSETFDISNGDYYKVMQWKDFDSITPVRAAQKFDK